MTEPVAPNLKELNVGIITVNHSRFGCHQAYKGAVVPPCGYLTANAFQLHFVDVLVNCCYGDVFILFFIKKIPVVNNGILTSDTTRKNKKVDMYAILISTWRWKWMIPYQTCLIRLVIISHTYLDIIVSSQMEITDIEPQR